MLYESSQGKKKTPSVHALARRLVLLNTSVWQCHLDGTHATNSWAECSFPAVFRPLWHLVQRLRKNRCILLLLALCPVGEREGERGVLSSDGEIGPRDRDRKMRQSSVKKPEAGRCCREHSHSRLQTDSCPHVTVLAAASPRRAGGQEHSKPGDTRVPLLHDSLLAAPFLASPWPQAFSSHFLSSPSDSFLSLWLFKTIRILCLKINHLLKYRYFSPWTFPREWLDIKLIVALN